MNRERARELLPIIQAFAEGKAVQRYNKGWVTYSQGEIPEGHLEMPHEWRIKPEPREFWITDSKWVLIEDDGVYRPAGAIKVREVCDDC